MTTAVATAAETGPAAASTDTGAGADTSEAAVFLEQRPMLAALAYRLLGSVHDADDTVQDAYLRWSAVDQGSIENPAAFLTTVTTRLALDRLRSARARREVYTGPWLPEPLLTAASTAGAPGDWAGSAAWTDPVEAAALRESATIGMLLLVERLNPIERAVFVLREAFALPYEEIAEIVDRSPAYCRQLHHRAGSRAGQARRGRPAPAAQPDRRKGRALVEKFLSAASGGDLEGLKALLREDVVVTTDGGGQVSAAIHPIYGAAKAARLFASVFPRRHAGAEVTRTEYNHAPALLITRPDRTSLYIFDIDDEGRIANVYGMFNPDKLRHVTPSPSAHSAQCVQS